MYLMPSTKRTANYQDAYNVLSHFKRNYPLICYGKHEFCGMLAGSRMVWDRLDRVAVLSENTSECHSGCVNALNWSADGSMLLSGGDDTRIHVWKSFSPFSDLEYGLKCMAKIHTGHTNNIFNIQILGHPNRIATCAADRQVRVFDINEGLGGSHMIEMRERNCIRIFRCHRRRVKRIITENSPDHFLTVAEDGTVRQHDLRIQHKCSSNGDTCSAVLVEVPFELSTISMSGLTPYHFVVAGESPYAFLFDRRQVGRRIHEEWGVHLSAAEITTCVRRFGRPPSALTTKNLYHDHITGSRMSQTNGHELLLSYSGDAVYSFSTRDDPEESLPSSTSTLSINGLDLANVDREESPEDFEDDLEPPEDRHGRYDEDLPFPRPPMVSPRQKYIGTCNVRTIKDVNFAGPRDEYVVSGSDDGNFFIWDKKTGDIVDIHEGDGSVVNVIEPHPFLPVLAVSGIDDTVKIFGPRGGLRKSSRLSLRDEIVENNASRGFPFRRPRLGMEDLFLRLEEASAGQGVAENIECVYQ